jgi:hypothetical protein
MDFLVIILTIAVIVYLIRCACKSHDGFIQKNAIVTKMADLKPSVVHYSATDDVLYNKLGEKAQVLRKRHQEILFKDDPILMEELNNDLTAMKEHIDNLGPHDEFIKLADNFLGKAMRLSDPSLTIAYVNIALCEYNLPFQPTELNNFDMFHQRYGNMILELSK